MVELSPTTTYLADTNLFIRAGTPQRETAQALIAFFAREHWTLIIHPEVDEELTDEARTYTRHRTLQRALDEGWATRGILADDPVAPSTDIEEAARECIAERTNRPTNKVEATDVKLIALAAERLERGIDTDIGIITNDAGTGVCFDRVLDQFGYDRAEYIDAKRFLGTLTEWHADEDS